jgi:hypothetical protein
MMTDETAYMTAEASRALGQRRRGRNLLLMAALFGFVGIMFALSFVHLSLEMRTDAPDTVSKITYE